MVVLQGLRIAGGFLGGIVLAQGVAFSFDGTAQAVVTYLIVYGIAAALFLVGGGAWYVIHRRQHRPPLQLPVVHFKLNRSEDLSVRLREDHRQSVLLEVGVENPNNVNLTGVNANVLVPVGLRSGDDSRCDLWGEHQPGGGWAPPTPHRVQDEADPYKEYWNDAGLILNSGSRIFAFKLHLKKPGVYRVLAKFWGGELPEPLTKDAAIEVVEGNAAEQSARDKISEVIYRGEQMLGWEPSAIEDTGSERMAWFLDAIEAVPDELTDVLNGTQDDKASNWVEDTRRDLRALYDIRGRLADSP